MKKYALIIVVLLCVACERETIRSLQPEPAAPVTDIDGNVYATVKIGSQIWMTENLRVRHYADGTAIAVAPDSCITTAYPDSYEVGGQLFERADYHPEACGLYYNWAAATRAANGSSALSTPPTKTQGVCPEGWRLPSRKDWHILWNNLGGMAVAGGRLKTQTDWQQPNVGATNESALQVLPAAQYILSQEMIDKSVVDGFDPYGFYALFWAADAGNAWMAYTVYIGYQQAAVEELTTAKTAGICVRCMMDVE